MSEALSLTVKLETVTPLFLGGANPRGAPELRAPSFRGALRYWLRAALGGVIGDQDYELLHIAESKVFGSTDEKMGGASVVNVRIQNERLSPPRIYSKQTGRDGKPLSPPAGRDYLFWSMDKSGNPHRGNEQPAKQYYDLQSSFDLVLASRPGVSNASQAMEQATAALWLLLNLGSVGSRARRGGGSLVSQKPLTVFGDALSITGTTIRSAAEQLGDGLSAIRRGLALNDAKPQFGSFAEFDILHPTICDVWILGKWTSAEATLDVIGSAMRRFRNRREPDHANVARWLNGQRISTVERSVFGLPIPYRYSNNGPSGTIQGRTNHPQIDRRASPLWLKVSRLESGNYIAVATLFKARFLPEGETLYAKTRGHTPPIAPPTSYGLIEQWIEESFPEVQRVNYV